MENLQIKGKGSSGGSEVYLFPFVRAFARSVEYVDNRIEEQITENLENKTSSDSLSLEVLKSYTIFEYQIKLNIHIRPHLSFHFSPISLLS